MISVISIKKGGLNKMCNVCGVKNGSNCKVCNEKTCKECGGCKCSPCKCK